MHLDCACQGLFIHLKKKTLLTVFYFNITTDNTPPSLSTLVSPSVIWTWKHICNYN